MFFQQCWQVCDVLRALELTCIKLKSYIDQLLAVVLESNPNLLEAMPRIQQSVGMKLELFQMASLQEVRDERETIVFCLLCWDCK